MSKFCPYYFNRVVKKNKFIALGVCDSNNNQYENHVDGSKSFVVDITEFKERVKELAYGCEVLVDEVFLEANNYLPATDRTTIVLCDNIKQTSMKVEYKYRRNMTFIRERDFLKYVSEHELRRKTPLFFLVREELMEKVALTIDVVEYAQSDRGRSKGDFSKFGTDMFNQLSKKTTIKTDESAKYDKEQTIADKSSDGRTVTEVKGNFKFITKIDKESLLGYKYDFKRIER